MLVERTIMSWSTRLADPVQVEGVHTDHTNLLVDLLQALQCLLIQIVCDRPAEREAQH